MKKLKKGISFVLVVLILAGITTAFVKVHGTPYFYGTVEDCSDNPLSGAFVLLTDSMFNILGSDTTDSNGEYGFSATLTGYSPYTLTVTKTRFNNNYTSISGGGENNFALVGIGKKIGVFFWASDVVTAAVISKYKNILTNKEDYDEIFEYKDSSNVATDCTEVDNYEIDADTIFVYIMGHGYNDGSHSYTDFKYGDNITVVGSHTFKGYMDAWEANRKCILVESCMSGDWADDFDDDPYLAMSTANETLLAHTRDDIPDEGEFSFRFFYAIEFKYYNAVDAFDYACDNIPDVQEPKIADNSDYEWFD